MNKNEGEEEVGSTHLEEILEEHLATLKSDILILADTGNYDIGVPSITYRYSLSSLMPLLSSLLYLCYPLLFPSFLLK